MPNKTARFIKYDVHGNLFGSLRYDLTPAEYSIWDRLLALAKIGTIEGIISSKEWTPEGIVALFNLAPYGGLELYNSAITKLVKTERIEILSDNSLSIINWHKYQDVPVWVVNQRENLYKKLGKLKASINTTNVLEASPDLKETVDNFVKATNTLMNGGK